MSELIEAWLALTASQKRQVLDEFRTLSRDLSAPGDGPAFPGSPE